MINILRNLTLGLLGIAFIAVGVTHFTNEEFFVAIMPPYLPWHRELVYLSGVFEILGGAGLLIPRLRTIAGWGLIALMIAVFPANIHMAMNPDQFSDVSPTALYLRLPMQFVMIAIVWWAALKRPSV
jgi:uncharacterized membrane protein